MPLTRKEKTPKAVRPAPKKKPPEVQPISKNDTVRLKERKSGVLGAVMLFVFILCFSIALAFFCWMAASDMLSLNKDNFTATIELPVDKFTTEVVQVTDKNGLTEEKSVTKIDSEYLCQTLKDAGLIHYKWLFSFYCDMSHANEKVDPGEYDLKSTYDYRALIQNMQVGIGGMKTVDITIPEGFTLREIFERFAENKVATYANLEQAAKTGNFKYDFLSADESVSRLEGYLFPDTYQFYVGTEASSAINKLLDNFNNKFTPEMKNKAIDLGYSVGDIVKIASIIEKEAKFDEDRGFVASVIYNRLKTGMPLGMDTTILYLFPDHEGEPTQEMLDTDSPYNTHIYAGLPPTPICNPGMESINAALNPEQSDYYYFYADIESGRLNFFTNYNDFAKYVSEH